MRSYNTKEFGKIRFENIDNQDWYVGTDIASALGYNDPLSAVVRQVSDINLIKLGYNTFSKEIDHMKTDGIGITLINASAVIDMISAAKKRGPAYKKRAGEFAKWFKKLTKCEIADEEGVSDVPGRESTSETRHWIKRLMNEVDTYHGTPVTENDIDIKEGGMNMYFKEMLVTPAWAKETLKKNFNNRKINPNRIKTYAADMKNGKWSVSPQPICIGVNGELLDGQNRLFAVVESGVSVHMMIAFNVPEDSIIDRGQERTPYQSLYMRGVIPRELATKEVVSMVSNYLMQTFTTFRNRCSDSEIADFINDNIDDIVKVIEMTTKKKKNQFCNLVSVRVAIFAALKSGVSEDVLSEFVDIVNEGFQTAAWQSSAIVLRNYLQDHRKEYGATAGVMRTLQAENAIHDYVNHVQRRRVYYKPKHIYIQKLESAA